MVAWLVSVDFEFGDKYYIRHDNNKYEELYNPRQASTFKTKKAASEWVNRFTTYSEYTKVVKKADAIKSFDAWLNSGGVRRELPLVDTTVSRPYNNEDADGVLDWWFEYADSYVKARDSAVKYEDYRTWPKLYSVFDCLFGLDFFKTSDRAGLVYSVSIAVRKDTTFETFEEEFHKVVDRTTQLDEEDGSKILGVFDHFLSEGGNTVYFHVHADGNYELRGHWGRVLVKSKNLEEVFKVWQRERYY